MRYFGEAHLLLQRTPSAMNPGLYRPDDYPATVQSFLARHARRSLSAARALVAYVPRFYGLPLNDVFGMTVTESEAQLAVARGNGYVSWELFMARVHADHSCELRTERIELPPMRQAIHAMQAADLETLKAVVALHPQLLTPNEHEIATTRHLVEFALQCEQRDIEEQRDPTRLRPIFDWLESVGFSRQLALNIRLCGDRRTKAHEVQSLIDRGADPNWVAPNGYSVLEHAVLRYWNAEGIDRLAQYATVRRPSLWLAAGMGDVGGVARFFDHRGRLTNAGRASRPPFDVIGPLAVTVAPDVDEDEVLAETALVAFLADRDNVLEYLVNHGLAVNTLRWDMPFAAMAAGNKRVALLEALIRCGADLDLAGVSNGSAREMAHEIIRPGRVDAASRRIAELCGLDVDAIIAEREAEPLPTPVQSDRLTRVLRLAAEDARRANAVSVSAEHVVFGLLHEGWPAIPALIEESGLDRAAFRAAYGERLHSLHTLADMPTLPLAGETTRYIEQAATLAAGDRRVSVNPHHLLVVLLRDVGGVAVRLVAQYGGDAGKSLAFAERLE